MNRIPDLRIDAVTARHLADALQIQAEFGYDRARSHLAQAGVEPKLSQHLLSIRYDRRGSKASSRPKMTGFFSESGAG
jgi:hypothetical protein